MQVPHVLKGLYSVLSDLRHGATVNKLHNFPRGDILVKASCIEGHMSACQTSLDRSFDSAVGRACQSVLS